jgi:hypothetical protein
MRGEQENAAMVSAAKTRLEKVDERHSDLAEGNGFNFHGWSLFMAAR